MSDPVGRSPFDHWGSQASSSRIAHPNKLEFDFSKKKPEEIGLTRTENGRFTLKSESLSFPMRAREQNGQLIWESTDLIDCSYLIKVIENAQRYAQPIHLNTAAELESWDFILDRPNVSAHVVSTYSGPIYPKEVNQVIDAWSHSASSIVATTELAEDSVPDFENKVRSDPGPLGWVMFSGRRV